MSRFKVVVTARSFGRGSEEPLTILQNSDCEVVRSLLDRPLSSRELSELIRDADALISGNDEVDAAAISAARALKVISRYGVGLDTYDVEAASAQGIVVTVTPGANDDSVADLAIGLMLACARGIPQTAGQVRAGTWARALGVEIWRKTLGVVGVGRIGRGVVRRAMGFEMTVLCHDVCQDLEWSREAGITYVDLDELLSRSDFVSVHVPLVESTRGLIGRRELYRMKSTAFVINTARGGVIDEEALYDALTSGVIAGAALDVLENEPATDSPLVSLDNVIITGHMGAYTLDAVTRMSLMAAQNVVDVLQDGISRYAVNSPSLIHRPCLEKEI